MNIRWLDVSTSEGLRRSAAITVVLSVLLLGLGGWNLWDGDIFSGLGCVFGAIVFLWQVHRNYRVTYRPGPISARDAGRGDVSSSQD